MRIKTTVPRAEKIFLVVHNQIILSLYICSFGESFIFYRLEICILSNETPSKIYTEGCRRNIK